MVPSQVCFCSTTEAFTWADFPSCLPSPDGDGMPGFSTVLAPWKASAPLSSYHSYSIPPSYSSQEQLHYKKARWPNSKLTHLEWWLSSTKDKPGGSAMTLGVSLSCCPWEGGQSHHESGPNHPPLPVSLGKSLPPS